MVNFLEINLRAGRPIWRNSAPARLRLGRSPNRAALARYAGCNCFLTAFFAAFFVDFAAVFLAAVFTTADLAALSATGFSTTGPCVLAVGVSAVGGGGASPMRLE
jgi:hypothetical protein